MIGNYFLLNVLCPSCHQIVDVSFDAHIGELCRAKFRLGDVVVPERPLKKPLGPELTTDFTRPFWAIGLGTCYTCGTDLRGRIHIRDRRLVGATPSFPGDGVFASGETSPVDDQQLLAPPFTVSVDDGTF